MKNNQKDDYLEYQLPRTRKEEFKDLTKNRFKTIISLGSLLILFMIPLIISLFLKTYMTNSLYSNLASNETLTQAQIFTPILYLTLLFDGINIICYMIFFIGIAGASKIIKSLSFMEPIFMKEDFLQGIKENTKQFIIISLFISLSFLLFDLLLYSSYINQIQSMTIALWVFVGILVFTIIPPLTMSICMCSTYKGSFILHYKNAIIITLKHYFPYIGISLLWSLYFVTPNLLMLFMDSIPSLIIYLLISIYLFPLLILGNTLYCFSLFDKYININYKEILYKGLYVTNK